MSNKISIIIPIYNTPINMLERCFTSIEEQNYDNWEVIIVDSSSDKEIELFLKDYVREKIKYFLYRVEHRSISYSRNFGLTKVTGEYVCFCDADDSVLASFFESSISLFNSNGDLDLIIGRVLTDKPVQYATKSELFFDKENKLPLLKYLLAGKTTDLNSFLDGLLLGRVYGKMVKASILREIKFEEDVLVHEDNVFMFDVLNRAQNILVVPQDWYHYYTNVFSITNEGIVDKIKRKNRASSEIKFLGCIYNRIKNNNFSREDLLDSFSLRIVDTIINYIGIFGIKNIGLFGVSNIALLVRKEYYNLIKEANFRKFKNLNKEELRYIRAVQLSMGYYSAKFNIKLVAISTKVIRLIKSLR